MPDLSNNKLLNWILGILSVVVAGLITAGVIAMNSSIQAANKTGADLNANVQVLTSQVAALKETIADKTKDSYTVGAADQLRSALTSLIAANEARIRKAEDRLDKLAEQVQKLEVEAAERKGRAEGPLAALDAFTNKPKGP